jgi:hypothetical protein
MKRKMIYSAATFTTFMLGFALVSLLNYKLAVLAAATVSDPAGTAAFVNSTGDDDGPREISRVPPEHLAAIEIVRFDPEFEIDETRIENLSAEPVDFDLELDHSIENQIIALHAFPNDAREFKVEQRFETSMSVSDEGPHLDLTEWKHFASGWKEIKSLGGNKFLTSKIPESDRSAFPKVGRDEIYEAVLKYGDKKWADYARTCKSPNDGPCSVAVSRISFRVKAKENGKWKTIHEMNVFVPMGC